MYKTTNAQCEVLRRARNEGIDALRALSIELKNVLLNNGDSILDCSDVFGLEPDEMEALFYHVDRSGWNNEQIDNFIDRVICRDTLDGDLREEIQRYLQEDEKLPDSDLCEKSPEYLGKDENITENGDRKQKWVVPVLISGLGLGLVWLTLLVPSTQKTPNSPLPVIPSSRTISTLETNKLTIGVLGDSDRYVQLKTHLEKTFGDRVKIQFDGNNKTNYQTLKDNIARQKLDIVFTLSPMISIAAKDNGYTWIAKMFPTKPFYKSVLFVKADSPIQSLNDLQPKTIIALGDFNSASSFYMPSYTLYGKQLIVDRGNRGSKIKELVKSGKADVGAAAYPDAIDDRNSEFRIIHKSRDIPGAGVYLSPKLSMQDRQILKDVLLNAPQSAIDPKKANYGAGQEPDYTQFREIVNRVESILTCANWEQNSISFYCPDQETGIAGKVMSALPSSVNSNQADLELKMSDRKTYTVIIPLPLINQIPGGGSLLNLKNKRIRLIDVQPSKGTDGKLKIKIDRVAQIKILE